MKYHTIGRLLLAALVLIALAAPGLAQDKPNILVIWGDDVGWSNVSAYEDGIVGYRTPNIDRIASEGIRFTDYYAEQSCTAGRSAFITGQSPVRTGLTKVGFPGADIGLRAEDPTIAELLKPHGYMTGQFGKNHLGDKDEFLPSNHGFDEFFGNLYHLNAEEEPEHPDYPKDPEFRKRFGPRGVIHSYADGRIEDTGPLTKKRMETVDEEFLEAGVGFIKKASAQKKPFFMWFASTRMHLWTHLKPESKENLEKHGIYGAGMLEHDAHVGALLDLLDELGIADNTIVLYSTDNGPHYNAWPDGGNTPFRGEKNTNWEGGYRVPSMARWPGKIPAGTVSNAIMSHQDWAPTLLAAAGDPDVSAKLLKGHKAAGKTFKVNLDGYNFLPYLTGKTDVSPRQEFFYFSDDGSLVALRYNNWKLVFMEQRAHRFDVWAEPFISHRLPKVFNLRMDPYERADTDSNAYGNWWLDHVFLLVPAQAYVRESLETFRKFPPRQKPAKFNLEAVLAEMQDPASN